MIPRLNPFRAEQTDALRYRFGDGCGSWQQVFERWQSADWIGCIAGRRGCGKSTFMASLAERLHELNIKFRLLRLLPEESTISRLRHWGRIERDSALLLDGAGLVSQLELAVLRRLFSSGGKLLVTVHAADELPGWPVIHECRYDKRLATEIIYESAPDLPAEHAAKVIGSEDNLRAVLRRLYDESADLK